MRSAFVMRWWLFGAACVVVAATVGDSALAVQRARTASPRTSFAARVTLGPGGSHILGNPAASVKLTEYVSYTCSHCRDFARDSASTLRAQVARGVLSTEIRHIVRDPVDMAAAVLANCGPASGFFARHEALMGEQDAILARVSALTQTALARWGEGPPAQRLRTVAMDSGIAAFMRNQGLNQPQIDRCLADTSLQTRLIDMTNGGTAAGVEGTPTFFINGQRIEATHNWAALQPVLATLLRPPAPSRR